MRYRNFQSLFYFFFPSFRLLPKLELIDGNRKQLEADLKNLDPAERWRVVEKLIGYVVPKMSSVEAKVEFDKLTDEQLDSVINELTKGIDNE